MVQYDKFRTIEQLTAENTAEGYLIPGEIHPFDPSQSPTAHLEILLVLDT